MDETFRRLVSNLLVGGIVWIQKKPQFQKLPWFFSAKVESSHTREFNVSSERLLVILVGRSNESNPLRRDYKSRVLPIELTGQAYRACSSLNDIK